jgi:hypothetical protein
MTIEEEYLELGMFGSPGKCSFAEIYSYLHSILVIHS